MILNLFNQPYTTMANGHISMATRKSHISNNHSILFVRQLTAIQSRSHIMTRKEFIEKLTQAVNSYIENFDRFDSDPQLGVNPATLDVFLINGSDRAKAIEDSDEAVENAAAAHGMAAQEASDYQVTRNPDFYAVKPLLATIGRDSSIADPTALDKIAANYF